jgi:hypothetical protein
MWSVVSLAISKLLRLTISISSGVIEQIRTLCDAGLASMGYFYFDFRDEDKKNHRNLLLSLLLQLSAQSEICCDILSRLHTAHNDGRKTPSDGALTKCLKQMLSFTSLRPIYLVMDALDECPNNLGLPSPREQVLELVKDLLDLHLPNLHICVTSRPEADIRAMFESLTSLRVSLHEQSGQKEDIINYISSVVYSDTKTRRWRDEDKKLVVKTLRKGRGHVSVSLPVPVILTYISAGSGGCTVNWKPCVTVSLRVFGGFLGTCLRRWMRLMSEC